MPDSFGKMLMIAGGVLLVIGAIWHFGGKIINLGRLPGDINIQKEGFSFHFPIVTSIIISIVLSIIIRACLINAKMPNGEQFLGQTRQIFAGIMALISKKFNEVWPKKCRQ